MKKRWNNLIFLMVNIIILSVLLVSCIELLSIIKVTPDLNEFRKLEISNVVLKKMFAEDKKEHNLIENITVNLLLHNGSLMGVEDIRSIKNNSWKRWIEDDVYTKYYKYYSEVFRDLVYFPVAWKQEENESVNFGNSWLSKRTYGGERFHEGTDIMASNNLRGYFSVVSMTDGVVEKKGWLEQGGYRMGIRSTNGGYFYYAHLYEYAPEIEVGDEIKAGTVIGSMGDSGYGEKEGTVGKFDVHLHVGIYIQGEEGELSVNPYWILKYLENRKIII